MSAPKTASGGLPIAGLLGVAFVILKLCGVIAWPWLWVLAPFWAPIAILLAVAFVAFGVSGLLLALGKALEDAERKKRARR